MVDRWTQGGLGGQPFSAAIQPQSPAPLQGVLQQPGAGGGTPQVPPIAPQVQQQQQQFIHPRILWDSLVTQQGLQPDSATSLVNQYLQSFGLPGLPGF
jgi:hypothetical protein